LGRENELNFRPKQTHGYWGSNGHLSTKENGGKRNPAGAAAQKGKLNFNSGASRELWEKMEGGKKNPRSNYAQWRADHRPQGEDEQSTAEGRIAE